MEKELIARLEKVAGEQGIPNIVALNLLPITIATLGAIYAHIEERYGYRNHDLNLCAGAIDLIKNYQ